MQNAEQKTALIAMSGGVDSSIAAYLMRQADFRCMGTTMRLYRNEDLGASGKPRSSCLRRRSSQ